MNTKKLLWHVFSLAFFTCTFAQRTKISINEGWKFIKKDTVNAQSVALKDSAWKTVHLPHTWNTADLEDEDYGYHQGIGWYRKKLPTSLLNKSKKNYLYFEAVNQVAEVYLNEKLLTTHKGGYSGFWVDLGTSIDFSKEHQILAVKADNRPNPDIAPFDRNLFPIFGGIYRDVFLISTESIHFETKSFGSDGVFITPQKQKNGTWNLEVKAGIETDIAIKSDMVLKTILRDAEGREVSTVNTSISVIKGAQNVKISHKNLPIKNLWSTENPYLYSMEMLLIDKKANKIVDRLEQVVGFRTIRFSADSGFFLNEKPEKLIGVNRHQDFKGKGNALTDDLHVQDMKLIKEMGVNFVRLAHYQQDPIVLETCDKLGLLVWEETPSTPLISTTTGFAENCLSQQREMIRQHYNHPSVIIWGYFNEIYGSFKPKIHDSLAYVTKTVALAKKIDSLSRAEDPTRYTSMAGENQKIYNSTGLMDVPMVASWNKYYGWYYGKFSDFADFLENEHKAYPQRPLIISEYGVGTDPKLHSTKPQMADHSVEYQLDFTEYHLAEMQKRPFVAGSLMWNFIDFHHQAKWATPQVNSKGIVTKDRKKKDVYFLFQAYTLKTPYVKLATETLPYAAGRAEKAGENFANQKVRVYANVANVELVHNGKSIGTKQVLNHVAMFDVPFENGINTLVAKDASNAQIFDKTTVNFRLSPAVFGTDFKEIGVNVGSNCSYRDVASNFVWEEDKEYTPGSFGYVGGKRFHRWNWMWIGGEGDYFDTENDALYHTNRDSLSAYKFDVKRGNYELELVFAEYHQDEKGDRVMDVSINGVLTLKDFNVKREAGSHSRGIHKKILVSVIDEKGITINFSAKNGNTQLSGIKLRRL